MQTIISVFKPWLDQTPYLSQLIPDQVQRVDLAREVYARLDELNPSRPPEWRTK